MLACAFLYISSTCGKEMTPQMSMKFLSLEPSFELDQNASVSS